MDLSSPKLRKILVGVAIFVVVVFIVFRFFRRSNYAYPNPSEEGTFSIASVPSLSSELATFTTTADHGFSAGDLIYISGVTGIVYTEPITGYPVGAGTLASGTAVYINSVGGSGSPRTFTVKATNAAATLSGVTSIAVPTTTTWSAATPVTITQGSVSTTGTATINAGKITAVTGIPAGVTGFTGGQVPITQGALSTTATATISTPSVTISTPTVKSIVQPSMDKMQNTDLLACQTQYATDLITAPSTMTGSSSQSIIGTSAGNKTVTVNSTNGFANGNKVIIPGVLDNAGKAAVLEVSSVQAGVSLTFTQTSVPATSQTILPQTAVSNITTAYAKRSTCIQTSATSYTVGHCRYLPQAGTNRPIIPSSGDDPVAFAAYSTYQTDIQTIQAAYAAPLSRVTQGSTFPTGGTVTGGTLTQAQQQAIVEAARKADLANATQKYLASVCPGFYAQTSGSTTTDPSAEYKAWSLHTGLSAPTVTSLSAPTVTTADVRTQGKKFWAGGVTDASIMAWAYGAGIVTLSGPVLSVTIPGSGIGTGYTAATATVTFSDPPTGTANKATGTATVSDGKITGVTITDGGSGYTTNPTITFGTVSGATAPTPAELGSIVVQISTSLSATGPLVPAGITFASGGSAITYSATKYSTTGAAAGTEVNWRIAYKNGPGTYPKATYA
jgi:hypothetical protein